MRGIIFAAVIGLAAPVIHQVESLPGWSLLSEVRQRLDSAFGVPATKKTLPYL